MSIENILKEGFKIALNNMGIEVSIIHAADSEEDPDKVFKIKAIILEDSDKDSTEEYTTLDERTIKLVISCDSDIGVNGVSVGDLILYDGERFGIIFPVVKNELNHTKIIMAKRISNIEKSTKNYRRNF